jgi:hypothetical protein
MTETTYTQSQLDIEILKTKSDSTTKTLERVELKLATIEDNMTRQYSNFTNYILGIYGLILGACLAHLGGVF